MKKELQMLGLTKNESAVYEILVKNGPSKAGVVIAKLDLHRNLIYRALDGLVTNGYATKVIHNGVWTFQTTDPKSLLTSMRRKEAVFADVLEQIQHYQKQVDQQIVVYEGLESFRNYWINALERAPEGTVDYVAGGELENWGKYLGPVLNDYLRIAKEKKISYKTIYYGLSAVETNLLKQNFSKPLLYETRVWNTEYNFFGNFNVFHDTVILHTHKETPRIIEMRDPALVHMFQGYFDLMWEKSDPVTF